MRRRGPSKSVPALRKHKASGKAIVTLNGRDHYLGLFGSDASKQKYDQLIGEWLANGRQMPKRVESHEQITTVAVLSARYWKYAQGYYVKNGKPTDGLAGVKSALSFLLKLYCETPADEFGPLMLRAVRDTLDVGETNLDDRSVPTICQLSRLRNLGLFDTKISDSGLSDLSGMSDLQSIEIGKTLVTEKGVAQFKLSLPNCIVEHDVYPAT